MPTPNPPERSLTPGERAQWRALSPGPRRRDWLLGRAALKQLLGAGADTSGLRFPHPRLSLTHAGGRAFAVNITAAGVVGTGIDYEPWNGAADLRTARFFLRMSEQVAVRDAATLLRVWTVKEALYKATPDNAEVVLLDYELHDPRCAQGSATGPRGERLHYASLVTFTGVLSIAVCVAGEAQRVAV